MKSPAMAIFGPQALAQEVKAKVILDGLAQRPGISDSKAEYLICDFLELWSDEDTVVLGLERNGDGTIGLTSATKLHPNLAKVLNAFLRFHRDEEINYEDASCTTIVVNKTAGANRRRARHNGKGAAFARELGDCQAGGGLRVWTAEPSGIHPDRLSEEDSIVVDARRKLQILDRKQAYEYGGSRFNLVFYCIEGCEDAPTDVVEQLGAYGFCWPSTSQIRKYASKVRRTQMTRESIFTKMILPFAPEEQLLVCGSRAECITSHLSKGVCRAAHELWILYAAKKATIALSGIEGQVKDDSEMRQRCLELRDVVKVGFETAKDAANAYTDGLIALNAELVSREASIGKDVSDYKGAMRDVIVRLACVDGSKNNRERFEENVRLCFPLMGKNLSSQLHGSYRHSMALVRLKPFNSNNSVANSRRKRPRSRRKNRHIRKENHEGHASGDDHGGYDECLADREACAAMTPTSKNCRLKKEHVNVGACCNNGFSAAKLQSYQARLCQALQWQESYLWNLYNDYAIAESAWWLNYYGCAQGTMDNMMGWDSMEENYEAENVMRWESMEELSRAVAESGMA